MTSSEIKKLKSLDQWFNRQQILSSKTLSSLNVLSRDKFKEKSFVHDFDPEIKLVFDEESGKIIIEQLPERSKFESGGRKEFSEIWTDVIETANAKIKLTKLLNQR